MSTHEGHRHGTDRVTREIADRTGILFGLKESAPDQRPGEVPFVLGCETCGWHRHGYFRVAQLVKDPNVVADWVRGQGNLIASKSGCSHWPAYLVELPKILVDVCRGDDFRRGVFPTVQVGPYGPSPILKVQEAAHKLRCTVKAAEVQKESNNPSQAVNQQPPAPELNEPVWEHQETAQQIRDALHEGFGVPAELADPDAVVRKNLAADVEEKLFGWLGETFGGRIEPEEAFRIAAAMTAIPSLECAKQKVAWLASKRFPPKKITRERLARLCGY